MEKFLITKHWEGFINNYHKPSNDKYNPVVCMTEEDAIAFVTICEQQGLRWSIPYNRDTVKTNWNSSYNSIAYYCDSKKRLSYANGILNNGIDYLQRVCRVFER